MTRETKIGLLVGMGVIIVIGILISDHLSEAQHQNPAALAGDVPEIGRDMIPPPAAFNTSEAPLPGVPSRLPMPQDVTPQNTYRNPPAPRPDIIHQDQGRELYQAQAAVVDDTRQPPIPQVREVDRTNLADRAHAVQDNRLPDEFVRVQDAAVAVEHARPIDAQPRQVIHYVKEGETLATIARQYYGDPLEFQRIVDANKKAVPNPNLIRPGVRLMIPPKATPGIAAPAPGNVAPPAPAPTASAAKPKFTTYTLAEGDTLSDVAQRFFGSSKLWQKVYELNKDRIDNPDRVAAGTELRVPAR